MTGNYRGAYWRFLGKVLRRAPKRIARAISMAIAGEHMIRYTRESVLPRLAGAIADVQRADSIRKTKRAHDHDIRYFVPEADAMDSRLAAV